MFYAYCNLHGVRPEDVAFGFHAIVTDSLIEGPYGLNGGGDGLTARFLARIRELGGEVLTRKRVTSLKVENRQIREVLTADGDSFRGEWVISSLHPKATMRLLSDDSIFPPVFKDRLGRIKESSGIFGLYVACDEQPELRPDTNSYFFRSNDPRAMFAAFNPEEPPPVVFLSSPKRRWCGNESTFPLSLHSPCAYEWFIPYAGETYGHRSQGYQKLKDSLARSLLDTVSLYAPDLPGKIRRRTSSTPLTHLHFNGSEEGSSYGIYHSIQNTGARAAVGPR
ncbi:MAG: hypothetical protein HC902_06695, partial [Calothrix sp. SM1_5_4]|nr:hypothetical protein [Calothrix sp. SM1_5_4]